MASKVSKTRTQIPILLVLAALAIVLIAITWLSVWADTVSAAVQSTTPAGRIQVEQPLLDASTPMTAYLPILFSRYPWISPFGVEPMVRITAGNLMTRAVELPAHWVRLNGRISWRLLQPSEGDPIQWDLLVGFENELRALKAAGMEPVVIVDDHPLWATIEADGVDGQPSHCAAIRTEKLGAYAQFVRALVARYKTPEFGVRYWEMGNEPDVDPRLVPSHSPFGCWGDIDDPYYGGQRYGEMLKVVVPAIRAEDPGARVLFGGLLLNTPETTNPSMGRPELFLQGALEVGAGPYFDILAYHAYPTYLNELRDYDLQAPWESWGGLTLGKAAYLRQLMAPYGVDKPLFLDETGLMCPEKFVYCEEPDALFYEMQADHVSRSFVRGLSGDVLGLVWFTLDGPGWRYTALLDGDGNPKPVYVAYQHLAQRLHNARYVEPITYRTGVEAYAFAAGTQEIHVAWTIVDTTLPILIPQSRFIAAYDRDGNALSPPLVGTDYQVNVGFSPVYLVLTR